MAKRRATSSSAGGPPVEAPTSTIPSPDARTDAASLRPPAGRRTEAPSADAMLNALAQPKARLKLGARGRAHLGDEQRPEHLHMQRNRAFGLGHEIHRAQTQRLQRRVRALARQRRHHHDGAGALDHDAVEAGQAIHIRHMDIERDDIGLDGGELLQTFQAVAREIDLEVGCVGEDAAQIACARAPSRRSQGP